VLTKFTYNHARAVVEAVASSEVVMSAVGVPEAALCRYAEEDPADATVDSESKAATVIVKLADTAVPLIPVVVAE